MSSSFVTELALVRTAVYVTREELDDLANLKPGTIALWENCNTIPDESRCWAVKRDNNDWSRVRRALVPIVARHYGTREYLEWARESDLADPVVLEQHWRLALIRIMEHDLKSLRWDLTQVGARRGGKANVTWRPRWRWIHDWLQGIPLKHSEPAHAVGNHVCDENGGD